MIPPPPTTDSEVNHCKLSPMHYEGVPPIRLLPEYPASFPGRVLSATGSGSDPKPAGFLGADTGVPGYPASNVSPWSACLTILPDTLQNTKQMIQSNRHNA